MKNPNERICAFKVNMINSDVLSQLKQLEKDGYITAINVGTYGEENTHEVYVVFYDGEVYKQCGLKGVYRNIGQAKALVTTKSKQHILYSDWDKGMKDFYEMTDEEKVEYYKRQEEAIRKEKKRFEIKTYTECSKIKDL